MGASVKTDGTHGRRSPCPTTPGALEEGFAASDALPADEYHQSLPEVVGDPDAGRVAARWGG